MSTLYTTSTCRSCGAPIKWAYTPSGSRMPLDVEPSDDGNVIVRWQGHDLHAVVLSHGAPRDGRTRYSSHFRTCPNAAQHRQRKPMRVTKETSVRVVESSFLDGDPSISDLLESYEADGGTVTPGEREKLAAALSERRKR